MKNNQEKNKRIVLLDGNAIIHRSFHALPPFTTKKGELVNAVYGFASTLLAVIDKFKPEYIVATFDLKGPTFRHDQFEDYKATRAKAPDELYSQIERVKEVVKTFNIPIYEKEGFEADDMIGTIAKKFSVSGSQFTDDIEVVIVTGDMDTLQLVDDKIKVYTMSRGLSKAVLYDREAVTTRYGGLTPEQLKDYKGLRGDASDNIPGVKGIGEKGAITLLKEYQTLEGVYKNLTNIKGAIKEKLEKDKMLAFTSKELGTIKIDVPFEFKLEACQTHDFDRQTLVNLFQELGFYSLIKRLQGGESKPDSGKEKNKIGVKDFKYQVLKDSEVDDFVKELKKEKEIALSIRENEIAFSWKTGRAYSLEINKGNLEKLKSILEDENIKKTGWNLKNEYKFFKIKNISLRGLAFDVMLADYLLQSGEKIELERLILAELGEEFNDKGTGQISLMGFSREEEAKKLCQKVDYIWKLKGILAKKIEEISVNQKDYSQTKNLKNVFEKIEMPLAEILAEMEINGIKINEIIFKGISEKISVQLEHLEKKIQELAGKSFNVNSTQQLSIILFEDLKLPAEGIKKNKTGYSTAAPELEKLKGTHEIIEKIETYRELFKLKTTYLDNIPLLIKEDGRIHTTFKQEVAATGRLSSENPNLQNIPIKSDIGKIIRVAFEAEEEKVFVSADYSQIDLRVMAHMSNDKKMKEAFWAGEDIHTKTAMEVNNTTISKVTKKMRQEAKALNFGIIYGMGTFGFAQSANISRAEAKKFIDEYMENFSQVAQFIKNTKESAKKDEFVETETGRRRYLSEINSPNFMVQSAAERMAINMPIQGLAADIMKLAMIKVYEYYKNNEAVKIILQIHDEIILEVDEDKAPEVAKKTKEIMEKVYPLSVPLTVDVKIGKNWGEL
ncbi:MAG: polymerase protein [Candidatus Moranbacteria bacterium GW2011_GWE1_35_17]|nr:MAG: polymerase protein [Candidatus Moranbacteria bacterium GW2011_GWE2_35_164]KKP68845.1 MAG: polymerase protein [Candidatus Moranbacteria bacterium GW2011_GWE1_35_17]KKP82082.1 MAG: polymerase protein [Candidatus Moranbacteria bacterium GW2011_GWF1_35_5]KKP84394.1 MAG: polymerase protein [Candidatus Moranbacteria bacterium GW2011_GWF2_35_54]